MSGSGQDTMVSSEVEVAVDPDTAFAAFTEELGRDGVGAGDAEMVRAVVRPARQRPAPSA
jgi:hypothetical protein